MGGYLSEHGTRVTPQHEKARNDQTENSAGGFVWAVDDWTRLRRFLILGSEGGSYYASERTLTFENVEVVRRLAASDGVKLVGEITEISEAGRAPQNDPALFALACAISLGDTATKRAAAEALPRVARIGTHLFHFVTYAKTMRGTGRTLRWAIANWYETKAAKGTLAYDLVKYRQRDGISHRDLLRIAHPTITDPAARDALGFVSGNINHRPRPKDAPLPGRDAAAWLPSEQTPEDVEGFIRAGLAKTPRETADIIRYYAQPREAVKPEHLTDPDVWRALLDVGMPVTALVRNLGNMTRLGVLDSGEYRDIATGLLYRDESILKSRIHPLAVLTALATYASGHGLRGGNTWQPVPRIIDALDSAFYKAFGNVEATGKRILLALDVSGSMGLGTVAGSPLSPRAASAALALLALNVEADVDVMAFSSGFVPVNLSARQRLDDAVRTVSSLPFERTDCALPMLWALGSQATAVEHTPGYGYRLRVRGFQDQTAVREGDAKQYDLFVVYTDSETWFGSIHPFQALQRYRDVTGIPARLAVCGMVSNGFTIADPNDPGMLDVVGFDTATPQIISDFALARI